MCGIAGFWVYPPLARDAAETLAQRMATALGHRGPDDSGVWLDERVGIALGHRRLSIIDLSPAGHQPMFSADGRWVISFNGEIYNFLELKNELEGTGRKFRGGSDTEVILEAVSAWGFEKAIARLGGMFAFALWDRAERRLYLARDRVGKKPLYLYRGNRRVLFGSELKALCAAPAFPREIDRRALALFLRYAYVPSPFAIYRDVIKIMPGQYVVIGADERGATREPSFCTYWDALAIAEEGRRNPLVGSDAEIIAAAEELITDAVRQRMIADVPLGALLSGGIDSSAITALMQKASARPIRTFTIGFNEAEFDEAGYARAIAHHLGTDHTELYFTPRETLEVIPRLPEIYDEPFADSSQIPTWAVSKLARSQVTVALSGDGGDELFGGYNRYLFARQSWDTVAWMPAPLRHLMARSVSAVPRESWDRVYYGVSLLLPAALRANAPGDKMHKFAQILDSASGDLLYRQLVSCWMEPEEICNPGGIGIDHLDPLVNLQSRLRLGDFSQQMMLLDLKTYLPEDILVKVDRASMAVSLEMRAPFLDHRVIEFMWRLPLQYKIRGSTTKWLLRRILYRHVPRELVERPKTGFGIPLAEWLRGPLKDWAEDLLSETRLREDGFFRAEVVRRYWQEHSSGARDWKHRLWTVLMFQAWAERWQ